MGYKHDYDKTMTRLTVIIQKLYEGESLSVQALAEEFGVSTRTIQRDFNEKLTQFPIVKNGKLWKMREGFHIEKLKSVEDQLVLDMMENLSTNLGSKFSLKVKHLLSKIKNPDISPLYSKLNIENLDKSLEEINTIESAIKNQNIITCNYKIDKSSYKTILKPIKITNFEGYWYLIALDSKEKDKLKKYHLQSISNINITKDNFKTQKELNETLDNAINIWFDVKEKPQTVLLHVDGAISKYFERKPISKTQTITSINSEDDSMELSIQITHAMEIIPTVLRWIPYIKVIEPTWLKDEIEEKVTKYIE